MIVIRKSCILLLFAFNELYTSTDDFPVGDWGNFLEEDDDESLVGSRKEPLKRNILLEGDGVRKLEVDKG